MDLNMQIIAKEGWRGALIILILALILGYFDFSVLSTLCFIALITWLFAFRNPERQIYAESKVFLAHIDGVVESIDEAADVICVIVKTRVFDVGVVRAPIDIGAGDEKRKNGLSLFANADKKQKLNTIITYTFEDYKLEFFPEFFNNSRLHTTSHLGAGDRAGYMKIGISKVFLPGNYRVSVNVGDKIYAGKTIIGTQS